MGTLKHGYCALTPARAQELPSHLVKFSHLIFVLSQQCCNAVYLFTYSYPMNETKIFLQMYFPGKSIYQKSSKNYVVSHVSAIFLPNSAI